MKYALMPTMASFDEKGLALNDGWALVYNVNPITQELISCTYARVTKGVSVAAHAYTDAPEDMGEDYAIVRDGDRWSYVKDYRNQTVYRTDTGQPFIVVNFGELADTLTTLKPTTEFDKWDGEKWVTDDQALIDAELNKIKAKYETCLATANEEIKWRETALSIKGMERDGDAEQLLVWQKYRIELARLDLNDVNTVIPDLPY